MGAAVRRQQRVEPTPGELMERGAWAEAWRRIQDIDAGDPAAGWRLRERFYQACPADWRFKEWRKCRQSPAYFIDTYCRLKDEGRGLWVPFHLWPAQIEALEVLETKDLSIFLKARQIGLTWLALAFALWLMLFRPAVTILVFSVGQREAKKLITRMKGMYGFLPGWLQCDDEDWLTEEGKLSNGSEVTSLPSTAGDSFTASLVIIDEADLIDGIESLMESAKPTIDDGGKMVMLSRSNKDKPDSYFKDKYRAAKKGDNDWTPVFLPWHARPSRDQEWYEKLKKDALSTKGSLDSIRGNYPATDEEALSARSQNKRLPPQWLSALFEERKPMHPPPADAPAIEELRIHVPPEPGRRYRIGADPAEGVPSGDDSALCVVDDETGAAVAHAAGKWEPKAEFGRVIKQVSAYYNDASVLVELNNHGHAVVGWLEADGTVEVLEGHNGKAGWDNSGRKPKAELYDEAAALAKSAYVAKVHAEEEGGEPPEPLLFDFAAWAQLAAIDRKTLKHPQKNKKAAVDDEATAFVLANRARSIPEKGQLARRARNPKAMAAALGLRGAR